MKSKRQLLAAAVLATTTLAVACSGGAAEPDQPAVENGSAAAVTAVPTLRDRLAGFSPLKNPVLLAAVFAGVLKHYSGRSLLRAVVNRP